LLEQFGKNRRVAQKRYRKFVRDGIANRPWDALKGQIYLGSDKFIKRHSAKDKELKDSTSPGEKGDRHIRNR
jgi:putative transposase